jgi:hypothetical protein
MQMKNYIKNNIILVCYAIGLLHRLVRIASKTIPNSNFSNQKMVYFFVLIASIITSCTKDKNSKTENPIVYTELNPSIQITSVDTLINHLSGCGLVPSPSDSTATFSIDLNNDNSIDFILTCSSWYHFVSASDPCANYNTSMVISGTSASNKVSIAGNYNIANHFQMNESIDNYQTWSNSATLMLNSALAPFSTNFNSDVFLGLKMTTTEGDYFGWIHIDKNGFDISVLSYAIHQTLNCTIQAGQKE